MPRHSPADIYRVVSYSFDCGMKIVITSPSFDAAENVSGISAYAAAVVSNSKNEFVHFAAGKKDGERHGFTWAARQAGLPLRFFSMLRRERPDIVHINSAMEPRAVYRDVALALAAGFFKIPCVLHLHGGRFFRETSKSSMFNAALKKLLGTVRKIVVLGDNERKALLRAAPKLDVAVLPNAIDLSLIPKTERRTNDVPVLLFFGRIDASKGLANIADACSTLMHQGFKFRFECFGNGPQKDEFNAAMTAALGERYHYGGVVSGREKWKVFFETDIFLLPSEYEGLPIALLEAMAAGCIPVVSAVGSIPDVVEDGRSGSLVKPGDAVQLTGRLKVLLSDKSGWAEMRENARGVVQTRFDIKDHIPKLEEIYANAAEK